MAWYAMEIRDYDNVGEMFEWWNPYKGKYLEVGTGKGGSMSSREPGNERLKRRDPRL